MKHTTLTKKNLQDILFCIRKQIQRVVESDALTESAKRVEINSYSSLIGKIELLQLDSRSSK